MKDRNKTKDQLISELAEMRQRVTQLEKLAMEGKQAQEGLASLEARLQSIAEEISDIIVEMDLKGYFTYVSPSIEKIADYKVNEIVGKPLKSILRKSDIPKASRNLNRVTKQSRSRVFEFELPRKDGKLITIEMSLTPLLRNGAVVGVYGIARDI